MKVLIIEDSLEVVEAISLCLQLRWPNALISSEAEGNRGIETLKTDLPDIIILDINLPDIDGFTVLKRIRSTSKVPIIIVTVRGDEDDQARGLEMGADDYIVKPFKPRDVIARVNAVLRRTRNVELSTTVPVVRAGKLSLDLANNVIQFEEETIKLTMTESKVLYTLMKNAGRTISNETIMKEVWNDEHQNTDLLRTNIRRIREKLRDEPPSIVINQRGSGYRFVISQ